MKKLIALSVVSLSLIGCGMKIEEPAQAKPASSEAKYTQQECLAKSGDGRPVYTEYGTCVNYVPAPTSVQKPLKTESAPPPIMQEPIKPIVRETPIPKEKPKTIVHKQKEIKIPTAKEIQKTKKEPRVAHVPEKEVEVPELKPIEKVSIESVVSALNSTKITIKSPSTFGLKKSEVVTVLVENKKQVEKAKVILTANIVAHGMLITKLEANSQPLTTSYPAKWAWTLEADNPGEYRVIVNIYAKIITEDGQELEKFVASQRKDIVVKQSIYKRVGHLAVEYWYFWLAILAIIYGFLSRKKTTPE